jgi:hypothetical protein
MRSIATAALLSLAAAAAAAAGTVNVNFVDPDKFFDAGNSKHDVPANLKELENHMKQLGRYLPDGQVLNINVLDVDLAGYMKPTRSGQEVRIAKSADWPRITLRYTLEANGAPIKSGEEVLADLNFGRHGQTYAYSTRDPLHHEKVMLESWLRARFSADY